MTHHGDHDDGDRGAQARASMESPEKFFGYMWPRLLHFLISQTSDSSLAEEVAAETISKIALDNWDRLLICQRPDSYLMKAAVRDLRRMEAAARKQSLLDENLTSSKADLRDVAATDEWVADHLDLVAAMRFLPPRQSEVIAVKWLGECTVKETAHILGVTENTVKTQLSRAIEKLRVLLNDPSVTDPAVTDMARRNPS